MYIMQCFFEGYPGLTMNTKITYTYKPLNWYSSGTVEVISSEKKGQ